MGAMTRGGTGAGPISNGSSGTALVGAGGVSASNRWRGPKPKSAAPCVRRALIGSAHLTLRPSLRAIAEFGLVVARFIWRGNPSGNRPARIILSTRTHEFHTACRSPAIGAPRDAHAARSSRRRSSGALARGGHLRQRYALVQGGWN